MSLTYAVDTAAGHITVIVDKLRPEVVDSRYRVITPAGHEIGLTREDANWLGVF